MRICSRRRSFLRRIFVAVAAVAGTTALGATERRALRSTNYVLQFGISQFDRPVHIWRAHGSLSFYEPVPPVRRMQVANAPASDCYNSAVPVPQFHISLDIGGGAVCFGDQGEPGRPDASARGFGGQLYARALSTRDIEDTFTAEAHLIDLD